MATKTQVRRSPRIIDDYACVTVEPDEVSDEMKLDWARQIERDFPFLHPGMAEAAVDKWLQDPDFFEPERFKRMMEEVGKRKQRPDPVPGHVEHYTGAEAEAIAQELRAKACNTLECVPIEPAGDEKNMIEDTSHE